ncbi:MAG: hypothetical protein A3H27_01405 [Acidobacteria bacterium RIFCSPLOWO2_02_FULL_59_13]|nr:MAG: hypothetical protein A3H27_01405 [Acidobacteria bacterium RIFCSPLOWO2_02_FULL_59_13]
MKAIFSMNARAFLSAFLPMCLVLTVSFFTLNTVVRGRIKHEMYESLHRAGEIQNSIRDDYDRSYDQLLDFLGENARREAWVQLLRESASNPSARSRIHDIIGAQLMEFGNISDFDLLVLSDSPKTPITGCVRTAKGGMVHLDSTAETFVGQAPFCLQCHLSPVANLLNVAGTLYEITTAPIRADTKILGYLTAGRTLSARSLSNFTNAAVVEGNRVLLTTFPPEKIEEVENQLRTRCTESMDRCEMEVDGEAYVMLDVDSAHIERLYSIQSVDAAMDEFMRGFKWAFFLIGAGGMLLVIPLSLMSSRSLVKPITDLMPHLQESKRTGKFRSDLPTNSSVKEVNLLAETFNRAAEVIGRSHQELRALSSRLISAKEEESKRLARELHDVFSQKLAVLGMEVSALQQHVSLPPSLTDRLGLMGDEIGRLAHDVHQLSRQLHPSILDDLGLTTTLRAECAAFSKQHGIPAEFAPHNVPESLPSDISLSLYRIAQESLWNAAKHAEAQQILVTLTGTGKEIVLAIDDDGNGFDLEQVRGKGGLGLVSMEERVRLVNGRLSVTSEPGKGTSVEVSVPLSGS